ncbi:MAG TPA: response regulator transcription factor [Pseudomonadales bacterium]|nr:response regulator transcription factor [Pseudomonadales bacterium]
MRVLIVEDDHALSGQIQRQLVDAGFAVDVAHDGLEGLYLGQEFDYDAAIIDLGIPALSGMALIQTLRAHQRRFPIIVLTARGHWQDKVEGLEAGADDYMVKPFDFPELKARLQAVIRRAAGFTSAAMTFADLTIDTHTQQVTLGGQRVSLTSYEYNTLLYFAHHPGKVISKAELTDHLYDQDFDRDSNVIEVFVGRLRKKIDPDGQRKPITTLRGQGYRFELQP